jgi:hypothetical protein
MAESVTFVASESAIFHCKRVQNEQNSLKWQICIGCRTRNLPGWQIPSLVTLRSLPIGWILAERGEKAKKMAEPISFSALESAIFPN